MNELVERVARRLADVHFRRKMHYGTGTQDERVASLVEAYWRNHVPDARAAIEAMREPTKEMAVEGSMTEHWDETVPMDHLLKIWHAMIDMALK